MPSPRAWMTLQECFDRSPGTFPFSVWWRILPWGTEEEPYLVTFVSRDVDEYSGATLRWVPSDETRNSEHGPMPDHIGYAGQSSYALPTPEEVYVPPTIEEERLLEEKKPKQGFSLRVEEFSVRMHPQEWKQDQLYRKTIGHLSRLSKVSGNKYLDLAIANARSARAMQDPRSSQYSVRRYVMSWSDRRFPSSYHGGVEVEYDIPWYPRAWAPQKEAKDYQDTRKSALKAMMRSVRGQIQSIRQESRRISEYGRSFTSRATGGRYSYKVIGGTRPKHKFQFSKPGYEVSDPGKPGYVHAQPGAIEWLAFRKNGGSLSDAKIPRSADKHVGIELEFFSKVDAERLGYMLYKAGVAKYVQLKHDGSIRAEDELPHPHEVCILAKESEYEDIVRKVTKVLEEAGSKVNKTCGMHVHIDARSRNKETVFSNLVSAQNTLYAMNSPSRLEEVNGTRYCAYTRSKRIDQQSSRYHGINGQAYGRHQTIEVRIHGGTIQARKIINWVKLLIHIADRPEPVARSSSKLRGFMKQFDLPMELGEYIAERVKKFADKSQSHEEAA